MLEDRMRDSMDTESASPTNFTRSTNINQQESEEQGKKKNESKTPNRISTMTFYSLLKVFLYRQLRVSNVFFLTLSMVDLFALHDMEIYRRLAKLTILALILLINIAMILFRYIYQLRKEKNLDGLFKDFKLIDMTGTPEVKSGVKLLENLEVGDILFLKPDNGGTKEIYVPADVVLLGVQCLCHKHFSDKTCGTCMISARNLNGDNDVLMRMAPKETSRRNQAKDLNKFVARLDYEEPNPDVFKFRGKLWLDASKSINYNDINFVPRGSMLFNTKQVVCMVVYVGEETKIGQLAIQSRVFQKQSFSDLAVDNSLLVLMYGCFIISVVFTIYSMNSSRETIKFLEVIFQDNLPEPDYVYVFFKSLHNVARVIPISLLFTIEIVRLGLLIIRSRETGQEMALSSTSILDDLSRVSHILLDGSGIFTHDFHSVMSISTGTGKSFPVYDDKIRDVIEAFHSRDSSAAKDIHDMFQAMMICNHVVVSHESKRNSESVTSEELALVDVAQRCGYTLRHKDGQAAVVTFGTVMLNYNIIETFDMESDGEMMMFTIVKGMEDGEEVTRILIKGSLANLSDVAGNDKVANFNVRGMKTLCFAIGTYSDAEAKEVNAFLESDDAARMSVLNKAEKLRNRLPVNCKVVGSCGMKKKIKENVFQEIPRLKTVGIKLFLVSKEPMNLARAYAEDMKLIEKGFDLGTERNLTRAFGKRNIFFPGDFFKEIIERKNPPEVHLLRKVLKSADTIVFSDLDMAMKQKVVQVLSGEMTKSNRSLLWNLVQKFKTTRTPPKAVLALGNSAHDIPMMNSANISVFYDERTSTEQEATLSSADFYVNSLDSLSDLILAHGVTNSIRISKVAFFMLYKSFIKEMMVLLFWLYRGHIQFISVLAPLDSTAFNLYTGLAPILIGLTDTAYSRQEILKYPEVYRERNNQITSLKSLLLWTLAAFVQGLVIFYFAILSFGTGCVFPDGKCGERDMISTVLIAIIYIVVHLKIMIIELLTIPRNLRILPRFGYTSVKMTAILMVTCACCIIIYLAVKGNGTHLELIDGYAQLGSELMKSCYFWNVLIVGVASSLMLDYSYKVIRMFNLWINVLPTWADEEQFFSARFPRSSV